MAPPRRKSAKRFARRRLQHNQRFYVNPDKAQAATPDERAALRAQLDARIARLYGLNETEFAHILATFALVDEPTKLAARNAFRNLERGVATV